jgi:hypothetical protein
MYKILFLNYKHQKYKMVKIYYILKNVINIQHKYES